MADENIPASISNMVALLKRSGIILSPEQSRRLWSYHQIIRLRNSELNLTRIHNFANMVLKLYVDSILPGLYLELPSPLLDLGSGPGMPGIPLKIAYPNLAVILAESRQKRVHFLKSVAEELELSDIEVIGGSIGSNFDRPVAAVITRAVESMSGTLDRISGCLVKGGMAIFMKGPHCEPEIQEAVSSFGNEYRLVKNLSYSIPHTPHERRLVVFRRMSDPRWAVKEMAMKRHFSRRVESDQNEVYKDLKKLLSSRGIKKQNKALVSGMKQIGEIIGDYSRYCAAWISRGDEEAPPVDAPEKLIWYQLDPKLFDVLDVFGTKTPLLLIDLPPASRWRPSDDLPDGCSLLVPFQDPENVGAVIRSAVAFGVTQIILLAESANPYHPKALRSSGGTVLRARLCHGPSIKELPGTLPIVSLSPGGKDIISFEFPRNFGLLPGVEGPGLPEIWRRQAVGIPIAGEVESLNASAATAIALFIWSQMRQTNKLKDESGE